MKAKAFNERNQRVFINESDSLDGIDEKNNVDDAMFTLNIYFRAISLDGILAGGVISGI